MTARLEPKRVKGKVACRPIQEELNDNPYLKKSGLDKQGKAPIMGRITLNNSMAQFSCKLVLNPNSGIKAKGAGSHKVWGGR